MTLPKLKSGADIRLAPGETIRIVKNRHTGREYYSSNLQSRIIENREFLGVFTRVGDHENKNFNWIRRDYLEFLNQDTDHE
jgi:predicted GNAT superfamily acetyltransferase